jgi:hypothetical protein
MRPLRDCTNASVAAGQSRPCSACVNARRIRGAELYCGLSAGLYPCEEERAMPLLSALVFSACGRSGRFFVPIGETGRVDVAIEH